MPSASEKLTAPISNHFAEADSPPLRALPLPTWWDGAEWDDGMVGADATALDGDSGPAATSAVPSKQATEITSWALARLMGNGVSLAEATGLDRELTDRVSE